MHFSTMVWLSRCIGRCYRGAGVLRVCYLFARALFQGGFGMFPKPLNFASFLEILQKCMHCVRAMHKHPSHL